MAGIGIKLQKIYEKKTILAYLTGFGYSAVVTVAPMFVVIGTIMLMSQLLGYENVGYARRGLFSGTLLYIFIFSLLTAAPFNAVLSRYMSDVIYEERYEDILPCYDVGLLLNILLASLLGIPFCAWEHLVGHVNLIFVFTGFCGYIALVLVFYSMLYLSICKDYQKISLYFLTGMAAALACALFFVKVCGREIVYSMLLSLTIGFFLTAVLEYATVKRYFKRNSNRYRRVFSYFGRYWKLVVINFLYTLGLYIHNFVFWNTDLQMRVADTFVFAPTYDLASLSGDVYESVVDHHFYHAGRDAFPHTLQGVFGSGYRRKMGRYQKYKRQNVPAALCGAYESGAHTVYHLDGSVSALRGGASAVRVLGKSDADLSLSCRRIFYIIYSVCRNYFSVLL